MIQAQPPKPAPLLKITNLSLSFPGRQGPVQVLKNISLELESSQSLGIVGESGCGKSMASLAIMRLLPDQAQLSATELSFKGIPLLEQSEAQMSDLRGSEMAMIFQDPMTALNPCFTVGAQLLETLRAHGPRQDKAVLWKKAISLMEDVGIPDPAMRLHAYPHQLSGGMAQRVMIAQALALGPKLLIADEPTTALDVTIQAQILRLLKNLQKKYHMALILITHDIGVVAQMAESMAVMYAGEIVEFGKLQNILKSPRHPYTRGLLDSLPATHSRPKERLSSIAGMVPNLAQRPLGCQFHPRCQFAQDRCRSGEVALTALDCQQVRCHFPLQKTMEKNP